MQRFLRWMRWVVLCWAASAAASAGQADARLEQAQAAYDEAVRLREAGQYTEALAQGEQALALREAVLGRRAVEVASCLDLLGTLHAFQADYAQAEPLYHRALSIRKARLGKTHPEVAQTLNNLANLYQEQGLYKLAEPLYERALAIDEAALGTHHPRVAASLNGLASACSMQGLYSRAGPICERALAIDEEALGCNHPEVARTLDNLATLYASQGLFDRAEPLARRALAIQEAALGSNHPDVASSLNRLAELYQAQGRYGLAEPLCLRALAIREAALGASHPLVAEALNNLAQLRLAQQRLADAVPLLSRAFAISEQRLRQEALDFSESRLDTFLQFLRTDEERLYALLRAHPDEASVQRLALTATLLLKGRSVEEAADTFHTLHGSLNAQDGVTFKRLSGLRTQLASLALPGADPLTSAHSPQRLKQLASRGDLLEAALARRSAPLRALTALPSAAGIVDRVAERLPRDSALVEFISYVERPLVPTPGVAESPRATQLRYVALVLFPDAHIRALDLGPAEPIDRAASRLRDALARRDAAFQAPAQALYQLAFQPLLPLLEGTRRLFLSPDGQLGLVPFAALNDGNQFLVESFDFTYLTSGKDLLPRAEDKEVSSSVVILADPDFRAPPRAPEASVAQVQQLAERPRSGELSHSELRAGQAERAWTPLPGTREEAEAIHRLIPQAQLFLGPEATKERLLHLATPGVLHLATHGFFLGDAQSSTGSRAAGHFGAVGAEAFVPRSSDPLLRSGLVFAGALASVPSSSRSTLATALELAGLDLWGTQLVVLSACDTGRGDVKLGQGVYGLRRAFLVAGAETVVMSLWKVNDQTTRELMEAYYRNLLAGQGRAAALREAMRWLRTTHPHPHYWAPFIALGNDAPLRGLGPAGTAAAPQAP